MLQTDTSIIKLDINQIVPNKYQPRKIFDERSLNSLAESIKTYGILNPILVRKKDDKYEIIAGERRFRAAKKIGLTDIPVIIKDANEQQMAELALIENIQRQGLNAIEEAKSYEEIMRIGNQTQESLAKKLGKSQSTIANKIRLLSLPIEIQEAVTEQKISERHARSLISVNDKEKQLQLLKRIISEKLTVKETERIINEKEYTEKEIKQAIDDIMKSLNLVEEPKEKEEKEDDNMNNGNFFPNFDNNTINNNTSLNMMNAQSINQAPMAPSNEMVMPTMNQPMMNEMSPSMDNLVVPTPQGMQMPAETNPIPDFSQFGPTMDQSFEMNQAQMMPNNEMVMPTMNQPMMNEMPQPMDNLVVPTPQGMQMPAETSPIPDFNQFGTLPTMDQNFGMNPEPTVNEMPPSIENLPIPEPINSVPPMDNLVVPTSQNMQMPAETNSIPMMDTPLFNPDVVMPTTNQPMPEPVVPIENNGFEVPVVMSEENLMTPTVQQDIASTTTDKLSELINYLSTNGYNYKSFNNETENCIIIEIPKNY